MKLKTTLSRLLYVYRYCCVDYTLIRNVIHQPINQVFRKFDCRRGTQGRRQSSQADPYSPNSSLHNDLYLKSLRPTSTPSSAQDLSAQAPCRKQLPHCCSQDLFPTRRASTLQVLSSAIRMDFLLPTCFHLPLLNSQQLIRLLFSSPNSTCYFAASTDSLQF